MMFAQSPRATCERLESVAVEREDVNSYSSCCLRCLTPDTGKSPKSGWKFEASHRREEEKARRRRSGDDNQSLDGSSRHTRPSRRSEKSGYRNNTKRATKPGAQAEWEGESLDGSARHTGRRISEKSGYRNNNARSTKPGAQPERRDRPSRNKVDPRARSEEEQAIPVVGDAETGNGVAVEAISVDDKEVEGGSNQKVEMNQNDLRRIIEEEATRMTDQRDAERKARKKKKRRRNA